MGHGHDRLIRKLESATALSAEEVGALRDLAFRVKAVEADAEVVREGDRSSECCLVLDGLLVRQKTTPEGRRQIMSLHTPGDFVDLQSVVLHVMDHSVAAVGASTVAFVSHAQIRELLQRHPRLAETFSREALIEASIHREWILNVGARSAFQRTAHLLCELFLKMQVVGLATDCRCPFPLTQRDLADCMGLTPVHVNRTLQQLRGADLILLAHKVLTIPNFGALQAAGQFDPVYLHLRRGAA